MKKYTFILDFRGGTYISQVESKNIATALNSWARVLDTRSIKYWGQSAKAELINLLEYEEAKPLTGMDNVWCFSGILRVGFFIVNIVES